MANVAQGTLISWGATNIPEIASFTGPSLAHETLDVTDLDSTGKDYLPAGVYDMGEIGLELNYDPDNAIHDQLVDDCLAGTPRQVVVTWLNTGTAATTTWTFSAFATGFSPGGSTGDKLTVTGTGAINEHNQVI